MWFSSLDVIYLFKNHELLYTGISFQDITLGLARVHLDKCRFWPRWRALWTCTPTFTIRVISACFFGWIPVIGCEEIRLNSYTLSLFSKCIGTLLNHILQAILLGLGLQHKTVSDLEKELTLPASQIRGLFNRVMRKVVQVRGNSESF